MIIIMGSVKIEVSRVQNHRCSDEAQSAHERNVVGRVAREARLAYEIVAASYPNGLR